MAQEPTFDLDLDGDVPEEGLAITVDVPDPDGEFERALVDRIKASVIEPLDGIDVATDRTQLVWLTRDAEGGFSLRLVVGAEDETTE
jgi:hypothetical protein